MAGRAPATMRLYLVPISRQQTLLYAQRLVAPTAGKNSLADRLTGRAAAQWRRWEAAKGGWQRKVTGWGNALLARIDFAEWGLKSVPALSRADKEATQGSQDAASGGPRPPLAPVEVLFPDNALAKARVEPTLTRLATERRGLHRRGMWWSIVGMPLTAPFMLIPVIPNLPFFYLVFRAWSHWKALSGADHLEHLLANDRLRPRPSLILRHVYALRSLPPAQVDELGHLVGQETDPERREDQVVAFLERASTERAGDHSAPKDILGSTSGQENGPTEAAAEKEQAAREPDRLLLEPTSAPLLALALNVPGLDVEVDRAVKQVGRAIAAAEKTASDAAGTVPVKESDKKDQ